MKRHMIILLVTSILGPLGVLQAASPPQYINYQGVLRDANGRALDGDYDMEFHFYDSALGGNRLLTDLHTGLEPVGPVAVTGGLFNVHLGGGTIAPGDYASLGEVFGERSEVWLEVEIRQPPAPGEVLSPRVRVISAAYALNAHRLDGQQASAFGQLAASQAWGGTNLFSNPANTFTGNGAGLSDVSAALLGGLGSGQFLRSDTSDLFSAGTLTCAAGAALDVDGTLRMDGPVVKTGTDLVSNFNADLLDGRHGTGFLDTSPGAQTKAGGLTLSPGSGNALNLLSPGSGLLFLAEASAGSASASLFEQADHSISFHLAAPSGATQIFLSPTESSFFTAGNVGIGTTSPGERLTVAGTVESTSGGFRFPDGTTQTTKAAGDGHSLDAADGSPVDALYVNDTGSVGIGTTTPYSDPYNASLTVGQAVPLIYPVGPNIFVGHPTSNAHILMGQDGYNRLHIAYVGEGVNKYAVLEVEGQPLRLQNTGSSGPVTIGPITTATNHNLTVVSAYDDDTVRLIGPDGSFGHGARLNFGDGDFVYLDEPTDDAMEIYARLGVTVSSDFTVTGLKNFAQPHPLDPSKEIVFTSLEGNEPGTYFRGSARLSGGSVAIEVPEEFRLVTNASDLSVQLTARGPDAGLWVESADLERIVVRGENDTEFDYLVNGVRRGFENVASIRDNRSFVPEERGAPFGEQYPAGLRQILVDNGILNEDYTPNEDTAASMGWTLSESDANRSTFADKRESRSSSMDAPPEFPSSDNGLATARRVSEQENPKDTGNEQSPAGRARSIAPADDSEYFLVGEAMELGDVVVVDRDSPDRLRRGRRSADAAVVGIVSGMPGVSVGTEVASLAYADPQLAARLERAWATADSDENANIWLALENEFALVYAPLALSGSTLCKVDAGYGAIQVGDLLTTSPTPGHASRTDVPVPGTIVGKALEPLDTGTGLIKVLVMLR